MSDALNVVLKIVKAGQVPSGDQVGEALVQLIGERDAARKGMCEMAELLGQILIAHIRQDAPGLKAILDDFVAKRVQVIVAGKSGSVH